MGRLSASAGDRVGPADPLDPVSVVAAARAESYARVVATLIRTTGDWTLAEDCAQDALATALERWARDGVPANPGGWLMTVARNRATDVLRRATVEHRKLREIARLQSAATDEARDGVEMPDGEIVDDRLRLVFTCCHPALALDARVALTLRTVAGVPTAEIARAFLVTESTMTRRLTRAKTKIAQAGIPYRVPAGRALAERLPGVLGVVYLLFTTGYNPDGRPAFADEAVRLARLLDALVPGGGEVAGLLALCLLQHARRDARADADGELVALEDQDRTRWDRDAVADGLAVLARAGNGPYALQARIAAAHVTAASWDDTDWAGIATCYDELRQVQATPAVTVARAVAHGYAYGPEVGLALLAELGPSAGLDGYATAAAADLTARAGRPASAASLFDTAARLVGSDAERRALHRRAARLRRQVG